jgi:4,5-dihydroxyphthalate decarboxylase
MIRASTMSLPLTLACSAYDRTLPLALGDVRPQGIDLTYLRLPVEEIFWRMNRHAEFDASEMSLSGYIIRRSRGDDSLVAIPVFPSRVFRHSCIWVNAEAGIERPQDLKGKRVGVPEYAMTAAVWIRGMLEDDYGVLPSDLRWFSGGQEQPGRLERVATEVPGVEITPIGPGQTLSAMLAAGELDALITARIPSTYDGARVRRLFPDFRTVEMDYFRRTGIFPIMHTVVIRRAVLDEHPWVARSLYDAFCEAKAQALAVVGDSGILTASSPWLVADVEAARALMGHDFWPYSLEPNRHTLETLARYDHAQGLTPRPVSVDELFAPSTLDEYRI